MEKLSNDLYLRVWHSRYLKQKHSDSKRLLTVTLKIREMDAFRRFSNNEQIVFIFDLCRDFPTARKTNGASSNKELFRKVCN